MFSPVSTGLESAREPGPSTATVDSDGARVKELDRGIQSGRLQEAHQESTGFSSTIDTLAARRAYRGLYAQNHTR